MTAPMDPSFGQFVIGQPPEPSAPAAASAVDPALDTANARIAEQDALIRDLATRPAPAPQVAAAPTAQAPLGPQPDPTTQPDEFKAWMAEKDVRFEQRNVQQMNQIRDDAVTQIQNRDRARDIVDGFKAQHPQYKNLDQDVRTELQRQMEAMGLQELPADASELHRRTEQAMKDRTAAYGELTKPAAAVSRVEGTGGPSTSAVVAPPPEGEPKRMTMVEQIRDMQSKNGFFGSPPSN